MVTITSENEQLKEDVRWLVKHFSMLDVLEEDGVMKVYGSIKQQKEMLIMLTEHYDLEIT